MGSNSDPARDPLRQSGPRNQSGFHFHSYCFWIGIPPFGYFLDHPLGQLANRPGCFDQPAIQIPEPAASTGGLRKRQVLSQSG
jgi:hypothetical protein